MKAKLVFNLDEPSDYKRFYIHTIAEDLAFVVWDALVNGVKAVRLEFDNNPPKDKDELDLFLERLYENLKEEGINIDKLTY